MKLVQSFIDSRLSRLTWMQIDCILAERIASGEIAYEVVYPILLTLMRCLNAQRTTKVDLLSRTASSRFVSRQTFHQLFRSTCFSPQLYQES